MNNNNDRTASCAIRNTRMLHLVKTASITEYAEEYTGDQRIEREYFAWGYYNYMTYDRFISQEVSSDHCFEIRYPYTKTEARLLSDQFFSLLDGPEEIISDEDPFEYDSNQENKPCIPFLGIFLISLEGFQDSGSFEDMLNGYIDKIEKECRISQKSCTEQNCKFIWKIFHTLNCVDLCLVIRTDRLNEFPSLRIKLKNCAAEIFKTAEAIITPILFCEPMRLEYREDFLHVFEKNKDIRLNIRISVKDNIEFEKNLFLDVETTSSKDIYLFDIIGAGDYSVVFHMDEYFYIYSVFCKLRNGTGTTLQKDASMADIKSQKPVFKTISDWIWQGREITFHERFRFPKNTFFYADTFEQDFGNKETDIRSIATHYIKFLEEWRAGLANKQYDQFEDPLQYTKYISLLKDLIYTYNDLWFQSRYTVRGYMFYTQMSLIKAGIDSYLNVIEEKTTYTEKQKHELMSNLLENIHQSIIGINNYNKLLQNLQQSEVNHPNYEIQTKVNAEKYFLAYSNFLMGICNSYFSDKKLSKGIRRFYPVVSLDVTKKQIMIQMLFGKNFPDIDGERIAFYSIIFPDYPRFSNIFHVLPLLAHETTHFLRFQNRKDRNEFVIPYILDDISEEIIKRMACMGEDTLNPSIPDKMLKKFADIMSQCLAKKFNETHENEWERLHFDELIHDLDDFLLKLCCPGQENEFRYRKIEKDEKVIWEAMKKELPHLDINVKSFEWLNEEIDLFITSDDKMSQKCFDFLIMLCLDYYGNFVSEKNDDVEKRHFLYEKIKDSLKDSKETSALESLYWTAENLWCLTDSAIDGSRSDRKYHAEILHLFARAAWARESEIFARDIGQLWKKLDLSGFGFKLKEILSNMKSAIRRSMEEYKEAFVSLQDFLDKALGTDSFRKCNKSQMIADELLINMADTEIRFRNLFNLYKTLSSCDAAEDGLQGTIENIHKELYNAIRTILTDKGSLYPYIASESGSQLIIGLGINTKDPVYFCERFFRTMEANGEQWLKKRIKDQTSLYSEIFADLGMCAIFGFNAFGYLRFATHISAEELRGTVLFAKDFESTRFLHMTTILSLDGCSDYETIDLKKEVDLYTDEIVKNFNNWMKERSGNAYSADYEIYSCKEIREKQKYFYDHLSDMELKNWKTAFHYYLEHALDGERMKRFVDEELSNEQSILFKNERLKKLCDIYWSKIYKLEWIEKMRETSPFKDIGEQYNLHYVRDFRSDSMNRDYENNGVMTSEMRMKLQVDFVQKNYWEYKYRFTKLLQRNLDRQEDEDYLEMSDWPESLVYIKE